ncbi:CPBP family glutamic-type intramembrane protease [Lactiplantibacillus mudanjiangensis]|uniref:CPBP family glutamic-type intramembrane protease n=1 Tax=Lactiplantibacillus mudanjiangensis TaxID=1296538 RepID=UPI00102F5499
MLTKGFNFLMHLFIGFLLLFLMQLPVLGDIYWSDSENSHNVNIWGHWLALIGLTILTFWALWSIYRKHHPADLHIITWRQLALALGTAVLSVLAQMLISTIFAGGASTEDQNYEIINLIHSRLGLITLISANIISPVLEELFFRGIVQGFFNRYVNIWIAVIITNICFAFAHGYSGVNTVGIFITGCLFSAIYLKTKNLGTSMFAHSATNWLVTLINLLLLK